MRRFAAVCAFTAVILASTPTVAFGASSSVSMPSLWRYAHPEAKAVIGIEWSRLVASPLGQQIRQQMAEKGQDALPGMDMIEDVERVFITTPGGPGGGGENQPPAVIAVRGDFDLAAIRELAAEKTTGSRTYQGVEVLESQEQGEHPVSLALVDSRTLLLGDIDSVLGAIDHYAAADPSQASNPLYLRAMNLSDGNDIWLVAEASPADFGAGGAGQAQFLEDVEQIEAGISLQSGLGLQLNLGTATAESAAELATGLQMMLGMLMMNQQQPGMPNFAEKLQIAAEANTVSLALSLNQDELEQGFRQIGTSIGTSMMAGLAGASGDVEVRPAVGGDGNWNWGNPPAMGADEPPLAPEDRVIRIWGLDEGMREVPFGER